MYGLGLIYYFVFVFLVGGAISGLGVYGVYIWTNRPIGMLVSGALITAGMLILVCGLFGVKYKVIADGVARGNRMSNSGL